MGTVCQYYDQGTDAVEETDTALLHVYAEDSVEVGTVEGLPRIVTHKHGWWINVQWEDQDVLREQSAALAQAGFSTKMLALYSTAAMEKCNWINLDWDA